MSEVGTGLASSNDGGTVLKVGAAARGAAVAAAPGGLGARAQGLVERVRSLAMPQRMILGGALVLLFAVIVAVGLSGRTKDDYRVLFSNVAERDGAAIIAARGVSSAASAANAAIDHMRDWALGTNGKWVTMGIPSDGQYGIPADTMFGFAVTCEGGEYKLVEGLPVDAFSQECINKTLKELQEEQAGVAHLL